MRLAAALGTLALIGCRPAASPTPESPRCAPSVPETAQHPIAIHARDLAGDYDLILVQTQPSGGGSRSSRLHLAPLDSSARAESVGGPPQDLKGRIEIDNGTGQGAANAVLAGEHLRIGPGYGPGGIENLTITAVAPNGFWGWWKSDMGVAVESEPGTGRVKPDPAGYFCAFRLDPPR